jgi:transposase
VTTKLHLLITTQFHLIEGILTGGNVSDYTPASDLISDIYECFIVGDKGYDSDKFRADIMANNNIPVIPGRDNRKTPIVYDKTIYKLREKIERLFGKIKENKRMAMRFEKSDSAFLSFFALAAIKTLYLC